MEVSISICGIDLAKFAAKRMPNTLTVVMLRDYLWLEINAASAAPKLCLPGSRFVRLGERQHLLEAGTG